MISLLHFQRQGQFYLYLRLLEDLSATSIRQTTKSDPRLGNSLSSGEKKLWE